MLNFTKKIILEAGEIVKKYYYSENLKIENKSEKDLVTEADKACEKFLVEKIKAEFPDHKILGEESGSTETDAQNSCKWIIDPIDGTTNFAHKLPIFAISIGLEKDGEVILGIVYNPITGEMFSAEKGEGSYLEIIGANGINTEPRRLHVSKNSNLKKCLLCTGFHPGHPELFEKNIILFKKLMIASHTARRLGAASLDLAYTAAGYFDAFWEFKLYPWDVAAGLLLIQEAGGHVTQMDGSQYSIYGDSILASNNLIHDEMVTQLNS